LLECNDALSIFKTDMLYGLEAKEINIKFNVEI